MRNRSSPAKEATVSTATVTTAVTATVTACFTPSDQSTGRRVRAFPIVAVSFLARYRGATLRAYTQDLCYFLRWCAERNVEPLLAERPHLEFYLRCMEQQGLAPATIGRRFTTVAGFYRYAVIDGRVQKDPSLAVTRPRSPGRASAAPCYIRWSTPRCSPPPGVTGPARTPWSRCSG